MTVWLVLALVFLSSILLTWGIVRYALHRGMLDIPNARSSHSIPTPRGGGLSFVVIPTAIVIVMSLSGAQADLPALDELIVIAGLGAWIALIGFWDDHRHIPVRWRLLVHAMAAITAVGLLGVPEIRLGTWTFESNWPSYLFFTIALIWLTNLYNFMDGIDGLAAVEAICVACGAIFLLAWNDSAAPAILWLGIIAAAVAGFLVWNWPPAKIFMGDVGSGYLGFVFGLIALSTARHGDLSIWSWIILLGVFIVDATMTLTRRIIRKERWYEAHRSHTYQRLARWSNSHLCVTICVTLVNLFWLLPMAWCAENWRNMAAPIAILSFIPLIIIALFPYESQPESQP